MDETVLLAARARACGPVQVTACAPAPPGMRRLVDAARGDAWLLPDAPDGVTPAVLRELGLPCLPVEHPNETARTLAAALRCCGPGGSGAADAVWPGHRAPADAVVDVLVQLMPARPVEVTRRFATAALRRLHLTGWLRLDAGGATVALGPMVGAWPPGDLARLRALCHDLPAPREPAGSAVAGPGPGAEPAGSGTGDARA